MVDERLLEEGVRPDRLDRIWRVGLRSCWLPVRDLELLSLLLDVVLLGLRVGDDSRDSCGDWETEVLADDCWDDLWLSSDAGASATSCGAK